MIVAQSSSIATRTLGRQAARSFSASARAQRKVAVLGAGGGIGQPLSLLLKQVKDVTQLALYDIKGAPGVAADVSHINTASTCEGFDAADDGLKKALTGAEIILIPAGVPRKPGMTRDDLFNTNASIVRDLATAAAQHAPKAHLLIIANPVNSTVPICAEVYKKAGVFDPARLYGVTTLDVVRSSAFVSRLANAEPEKVNIQVVGGHSGVTIVPLLSQISEGAKIASEGGEKYDKLIHRIQFGGDEVVQAKGGAGSATLSMAYAAGVFTDQLLRALKGETGILAPTYVRSPLYEKEGVDFFASNVRLGKNGVEEILPIGKIDASEQKLLDACLPELKKGYDFIAQS